MYQYYRRYIWLEFIMDIRPSHTIYVNNLNEKIKKEGKSNNNT